MDVFTIGESFFKRLHICHVRGEAQFDLTIVSRKQDISRLGHKSLADLPTYRCADWNVLQIGICRRKPPSLRAHKAVAGVHAARAGIDLRLQCVGVGRFQLGKMPPFQHLFSDRCSFWIAAQFLQCRMVGRVGAAFSFLPAFEAHLVEENFTQLLGRTDCELFSSGLVNLLLERGGLGCEFL